MDEHDDAGNSAKSAPKRVVGRPFPKGVSGNPRGRPPLPPDVKEALKELSPLAMERLRAILKSSDTDAAGMKAVEVVLERTLGKVPQAITGEDGGPVQVAFSINRFVTGDSDAE